jgi:uncharacterized protein DUF6748
MRSLIGLTTLPSVLTCALAACSPPGDTPDELVGEVAGAGGVGSTTNSAADDAYSYFGLTPDLRKCPSPTCGGWFLKQLNLSAMKCFDSYAASCYAPVLDWSEANLSEAQQATLLDASRKESVLGGVYAVVRGRFAPTDGTTLRAEPTRFVITEGWVAESDTPSVGAFVRVQDNGLRCIKAPCPNLTEWTLNMAVSTDIAGVDFTPARLSDAQTEECLEEMASPSGLLVAGHRYTVYDDGDTAKGRTANAAYYRLGDTAK